MQPTLQVFIDHSTLVLAAALNGRLGGDRLHLDDLTRADSCAGGAAGALFAVDYRHTIDDMDGIEFAGTGAVAQA